MEIRVLRYFLTVVREESITKASEVLHITQPTLSLCTFIRLGRIKGSTDKSFALPFLSWRVDHPISSEPFLALFTHSEVFLSLLEGLVLRPLFFDFPRSTM